MAQTSRDDRVTALDTAAKLNSIGGEPGNPPDADQVLSDAEKYAEFLSNG